MKASLITIIFDFFTLVTERIPPTGCLAAVNPSFPKLMKTPEELAFTMLRSVLCSTGFPCDLDPLNAIGIHAILTQLSKADNPYEPLPVRAALIDSDNRSLKIEFGDDSQSTKKLVYRWVGLISQLTYSPSGWTLEAILMGQDLSIRKIELPDWKQVGNVY